jgi:hypothetical protein
VISDGHADIDRVHDPIKSFLVMDEDDFVETSDVEEREELLLEGWNQNKAFSSPCTPVQDVGRDDHNDDEGPPRKRVKVWNSSNRSSIFSQQSIVA